jgi:hypothetical protein
MKQETLNEPALLLFLQFNFEVELGIRPKLDNGANDLLKAVRRRTQIDDSVLRAFESP